METKIDLQIVLTMMILFIIGGSGNNYTGSSINASCVMIEVSNTSGDAVPSNTTTSIMCYNTAMDKSSQQVSPSEMSMTIQYTIPYITDTITSIQGITTGTTVSVTSIASTPVREDTSDIVYYSLLGVLLSISLIFNILQCIVILKKKQWNKNKQTEYEADKLQVNTVMNETQGEDIPSYANVAVTNLSRPSHNKATSLQELNEDFITQSNPSYTAVHRNT